jgi:hypothetical protein
LGKALAHGPARCSFVDGGSVVEFVVGSIPELHVVQIDEILDG